MSEKLDKVVIETLKEAKKLYEERLVYYRTRVEQLQSKLKEIDDFLRNV